MGCFKRSEQFPALRVSFVDLQHFGMLVIDLVQIGKVDFFNSSIQGKANAGHGLFAFKSGAGEVRLSVQALVEAILVSRREVELTVVRANSTTLGTVGGALVNEHFEALNVKRQVIDGIYAVGNDASGLYDSSYPTIEGLSNAFAWNSGRIAGRYASAYVAKTKN